MDEPLQQFPSADLGQKEPRCSLNYIPRRYIVVLLCFFAILISYSDRVNISVAVVQMKQEYGWSYIEDSLVLASFYVGYSISQVPGGKIADEFGGKWVLAAGLLSWSVFTLLTPLVSHISNIDGLGGRSSLSCCTFVDSSRSAAVAFVTSASYIGAVLALMVTPGMSMRNMWWLILFGVAVSARWNWDLAFYIFGGLSLLWLLFLPVFPHSFPKQSRSATPIEVQYILKGVGGRDRAPTVPWAKLLCAKQVWAIIVNQFCQGWGFYVLLSFMPEYFKKEFDVNLEDLGFYTVSPYVSQGVSGMISGLVADYLITGNKVSRTNTRTIFQVVGMLGPALLLVLLVFTPHMSAAMASFYLTISLGLGGLTMAGVSVYQHDVAPMYAGVIFAMGNAAATLPGIIGVFITGSLLQFVGWTPVFLVAAGLYGFGAIIWVTCARDHIQGLKPYSLIED